MRRKSGWYVVHKHGKDRIAQYFIPKFTNANPTWLLCGNEYNFTDDVITVVNETEIFDQLKERDEMREHLKVLIDVVEAFTNVTKNGTTISKLSESTVSNIQQLLSQARQFLNKTGE